MKTLTRTHWDFDSNTVVATATGGAMLGGSLFQVVGAIVGAIAGGIVGVWSDQMHRRRKKRNHKAVQPQARSTHR